MDLSSLVVGVIGLVAISMKVTDFLKMLTNFGTQRRAIATQLLVWLGATAVVFLYSASDFGSTIAIADIALNDMASATKVILGLAIGSAGSVAVDFRKAIDGGDTAKAPSLNI
jgi:hypothetical protein